MIWLPVALVATIEVILAALTAYLLLLLIASFFIRGSPSHDAAKRRRFAILVPAHDEERVIARLLESLSRLRYPKELFDVHVVADNCSDGTAEVARFHAVVVHERRAPSAAGKGQALRWLLERLQERAYDAYVVVDADSIVSPDFLTAVNARLEEGSRAVQGYHSVLNPDESWVAGLRALAFALMHYTRRLGLAALGASAGLQGNGMAFAADLREIRQWDAFGLAEDLELHAKLVQGGVKVAFAPEAEVLSEMPTSVRQARSQNVRWERGRLAVARAYVPRLMLSGLAGRDLAKLMAAADLLLPPQSIQLLLAVAMLAASIVLASPPLIALGLAILAGQATYTLGGLARARVSFRLWLTLGYAPIYTVWKAWLYSRALLVRRSPGWVRTSRHPSLAAGDKRAARDTRPLTGNLEKTDQPLRSPRG